MNGYNFTERVRKILSFAHAEAERRGHAEMTPTHIALGLIEEGQGVACAVLANYQIHVADLRKDLEAQLPASVPGHDRLREIPYTADAKKVLERSEEEARELHHSYVGTEHLLLALLHPEASSVGKPFYAHGLTREKAMTNTLQLLGPTPPPWP